MFSYQEMVVRQIPRIQTFKFKISALLVLMVMVATALVAGVSLLVAEHEMRKVIAAQEMSMLSSAAAYLDRDITSKQQVLRVLAESLQAEPIAPAKVQAQLELRGRCATSSSTSQPTIPTASWWPTCRTAA